VMSHKRAHQRMRCTIVRSAAFINAVGMMKNLRVGRATRARVGPHEEMKWAMQKCRKET
jgi:hypothetical protein